MGYRRDRFEKKNSREMPYPIDESIENRVDILSGIKKPNTEIIRLSVPYHAVQRYIERVGLDENSGDREDNEIRAIIRDSFSRRAMFLPEYIPQNFLHTVNFEDPITRRNFGFYNLAIGPDFKAEYDLAVRTIKFLE